MKYSKIETLIGEKIVNASIIDAGTTIVLECESGKIVKIQWDESKSEFIVIEDVIGN